MQNSEYGRFKTNQMKEHLEIIERFEPLNRRKPTNWVHESIAWIIAIATFVFMAYAITSVYHHTVWGLK